jgi:hypothetical protein
MIRPALQSIVMGVMADRKHERAGAWQGRSRRGWWGHNRGGVADMGHDNRDWGGIVRWAVKGMEGHGGAWQIGAPESIYTVGVWRTWGMIEIGVVWYGGQ